MNRKSDLSISFNQTDPDPLKKGCCNEPNGGWIDRTWTFSLEMAGVFLLLLFLLLLQIPQTGCKAETVMCTMPDLLQIPHKYYVKGDFIIGAIASQFGCIFDEILLNERPKTNFVAELL